MSFDMKQKIAEKIVEYRKQQYKKQEYEYDDLKKEYRKLWEKVNGNKGTED